MRKEKTIQAKIDVMHKSKFRRYFANQIATLEWVLGDVSVIHKREVQIIREELAKGSTK